MAKREANNGQKRRNPPKSKSGATKARTPPIEAEPENPPAPRCGGRFTVSNLQRKAGLALIAASLLLVASAGAWLGPTPLQGAAQWVGRGLIQASYAALLVLFVWDALGRRRGVTYVMLLGFACSGLAIWDTAAGVRADRLHLEADTTLTTFRDSPLDVVGLARIIERNPHVEAYIVMRDLYWDLHNRLDDRLTVYRAAHANYVEGGQFLDASRLGSRFEVWRAFYQISDLENLLASIERNPVGTDDLMRTVDRLSVDRWTRDAYVTDLKAAISEGKASETASIARERRMLARIGKSLKVLIDAKGRYRVAGGRVVFEDPADAARFAGHESAEN